jgi:hypothetical protein
MRSRSRSAWPFWRAYSSVMCEGVIRGGTSCVPAQPWAGRDRVTRPAALSRRARVRLTRLTRCGIKDWVYLAANVAARYTQ